MRKARRGRKEQIDQLTQALMLNGDAQRFDRKKKIWSVHDLKPIRPLTRIQEQAFNNFETKYHNILNGSAGTGKTFLSMYHALKSIIVEKEQSRIIICRSAVACRDQGFLPGTLEEKSAPFEAPYEQICAELLGKRSSYSDLKAAGLIEFVTTGYLRGITIDDAIIISDETQNYSFSEINTLMTRIGQNTRLFISADSKQTDLHKGQSGYRDAMGIWEGMTSFGIATFGHEDIVRSGAVKEWIVQCEKLEEYKNRQRAIRETYKNVGYLAEVA